MAFTTLGIRGLIKGIANFASSMDQPQDAITTER
jgi:hypothetical protein